MTDKVHIKENIILFINLTKVVENKRPCQRFSIVRCWLWEM